MAFLSNVLIEDEILFSVGIKFYKLDWVILKNIKSYAFDSVLGKMLELGWFKFCDHKL